MISERSIATKFTAIWKQNFPLLTPNYIRVFNETRLHQINPSPVGTKNEVRYDIVSEIAFNLSKITIEQGISGDLIMADQAKFQKLIENTAKTIWTTENYTREDLKLTDDEISDIKSISNNILEFLKNEGGSNVQFRPKIKGYGFIPDLEADLSIDDTLYEFKTVKRNFKSSDLKQLFIYLALRQMSENKNWNYAGLYNPRKGVYCKFNIKKLIYNLSGGKSPIETFENFLNGLVRDFEIDSKF